MKAGLICPSAQADQPGATIIGVVRRCGNASVIDPLPHEVAVPVLIDLIPSTVRPTEVLRFPLHASKIDARILAAASVN